MGYILYSLDPEKFRRLVEQPSPQQLAALADRVRDGLDEQDGEFDEGDPVAAWPRDTAALTRLVADRLARPDWYGDLSTTGKNLWEGVIFGACMNDDAVDVDFRVDSDGVDWDVIELAWKHLGVVPSTVSAVAMSTFGIRPFRYHPPAGPARSRDDFDREQEEGRASLQALDQLLGRFLDDVKQGRDDPDRLMEELQKAEGVSDDHKDAIRDLLSDDEDDEEASTNDEDDDYTPMHSMHPPEEVERMLTELRSVERPLKASKNKDAWHDYRDELLPALERIVADRRMLFVQVDT
ncbi:MAG: hypothetical protein U0736_28630 [Gemmataceae bacterium]